jgi:hypothetical protein
VNPQQDLQQQDRDDRSNPECDETEQCQPHARRPFKHKGSLLIRDIHFGLPGSKNMMQDASIAT